MSPLQQRIASLSDVTTHLITELYELEGLHERIRKAELTVRRLNRSARAPHPASSTRRRRSAVPRLGLRHRQQS